MEKNIIEKSIFNSNLRRLSNDEAAFFLRETALIMESQPDFSEALDLACQNRKGTIFNDFSHQIKNHMISLNPQEEIPVKFRSCFNKALLFVLLKSENNPKKSAFLEEKANDIEKKENFRGKWNYIGFYPVFALIFLFMVSTFLLTSVIPVFSEMYQGYGWSFPRQTQNLLNISIFVKDHPLIVLISTITIIILIAFFRSGLSVILLYLPLIKDAIKTHAAMEFCGNMKYLISENLKLKEAIEYSASGLSNRYIYKDIIKAAKTAEEENLLEFMESSGLFSPNISSLARHLKTDEQREKYFKTLHRYFEKKAIISTNNLLPKFNILMILITGLIVGYIVFAMYLPIFSTSSMV